MRTELTRLKVTRHLPRLTVAVFTATLVILAAASAPASASTALRTDHQSGSAITYHLATPYGTITYGWRPLTAQPGPALYNSASGCNQDVCIQITGSGAHVSDWDTQGYWDGPEICTYSIFEINSIIIRTGTVVCGGAGVFFTDWPANRSFPTPSLACNQWANIPGYPCETIET
jgi:hypothetical protein